MNGFSKATAATIFAAAAAALPAAPALAQEPAAGQTGLTAQEQTAMDSWGRVKACEAAEQENYDAVMEPYLAAMSAYNDRVSLMIDDLTRQAGDFETGMKNNMYRRGVIVEAARKAGMSEAHAEAMAEKFYDKVLSGMRSEVLSYLYQEFEFPPSPEEPDLKYPKTVCYETLTGQGVDYDHMYDTLEELGQRINDSAAFNRMIEESILKHAPR